MEQVERSEGIRKHTCVKGWGPPFPIFECIGMSVVGFALLNSYKTVPPSTLGGSGKGVKYRKNIIFDEMI